jgi:dynein intermediate chain 1
MFIILQFWEDPADAVRPDEGTLLPLWHFAPTPTTKGRSVTALAWNPTHPTLFAAGYGSFEPGKPLTGIVCCHTLSDASQPECEIPLSSSVLSLAFHPTLTYLLAIGCLDGSVHVIDISNIAHPQIKSSCSVSERHREAVWQVRWIPTPGAGPLPLRFQAVSSDGSLVTWELDATKELYKFEISHLFNSKASDASGNGGASSSSSKLSNSPAAASTAAAASSMDSHPTNPSTLLVGTQEGDTLRYCLDLGVERGCTDIFSGHASSIYTTQWNPFHPTIFLTASADWTVRIWDSTAPKHPILTFDMGGPLGDAAWSPSCSTVFAVATESGRVLVYDLAHSMEWPLCKQKVTQKVKLTKLVFSSTAPVLLVGDEK